MDERMDAMDQNDAEAAVVAGHDVQNGDGGVVDDEILDDDHRVHQTYVTFVHEALEIHVVVGAGQGLPFSSKDVQGCDFLSLHTLSKDRNQDTPHI
jgi:hypothetical protein